MMNIKDLIRPINSTTMRADAIEQLDKNGFSRRDFFKAGAMIVGFSSMMPQKAEAQNPIYPSPALTQVDSWIAIAQDETITGYSGKCEFGQGFKTVQYQLIADELYVPIDNINMIICDTAVCPDQGTTSGSQSHPTEFGPTGLRQALATAREALFAMASKQLGVPMEALMVQDGVIRMRSDSTKRVSYGQLVGGKRFSLALNARAVPKDPKTYTVLGTSVPRLDIPDKVTGKHEYVQNIRLPGMLHGKVVRPPFVGAKLVSVDEGSVRGMPGNVRVVVKADFVGVVADKEYQAAKAAEALKVTWSGKANFPNQETLYDYMRKQPSRDTLGVDTRDLDETFKSAAKTMSATYYHPYQMHGSIGTSCSVADVFTNTQGRTQATIWSCTQGVYPQRDTAAVLLGANKEDVRVVYVEGSGCYGLNGADTVSFDAALLSQVVGKPVRVQLLRKDEMTAGEQYGPAYVIDLKAGMDASGQMTGWAYESWSLTKGNRPGGVPGNVITGALAGFATPSLAAAAAAPPTQYSNNGNAASPYGSGCVGGTCGATGTVRSERILSHSIASHLFTGPLRSPARLQNTFANESFIDEIAGSLKVDPVQYRLRHLKDQRLIDVVNAAAKQYKWDTRPSPKTNPKTGIVTGRGFSCVLYEGGNGYCAMVVELTVDQGTGEIVVKKIVMSEDSGPVSNPDGMKNQMEGGALQGMSRALYEEVTWDDESVTTNRWRNYKVYKFGQFMPVIESVLIDRKDVDQMGAGECTITTVGSAIANAIFDATGARVRQIPFTPARVLEAIKARP